MAGKIGFARGYGDIAKELRKFRETLRNKTILSRALLISIQGRCRDLTRSIKGILDEGKVRTVGRLAEISRNDLSLALKK